VVNRDSVAVIVQFLSQLEGLESYCVMSGVFLLHDLLFPRSDWNADATEVPLIKEGVRELAINCSSFVISSVSHLSFAGPQI